MKTELTYTDVTESLCNHCAYCCLNTLIPITLDNRMYEYFIDTGLNVERDPENPEIGIVNAGACQHLVKNGEAYKCGIYGTRPQLCKDYNCVAWAKVAGVESEIVTYALEVYNRMNAES